MVQISKEEKDYLIKNGRLKCVKGKYPDLYIASKQKKSKRKRFYVCETLAKFLPKVDKTP